MNAIRHPLALAGAILLCAVSAAGAQTAPSAPTAPGAQGAPSAMTTSPSQEQVMEGPVKRVDPLGKTISVGWLLGLFSTTLEVTDDTRIAVEGTTGSLQDIREGDEVKAAYEVRDGKNLARSIEVTEAEPSPRANMPQRSPATSNAPSMGSAPTSEAPPAGGPKAP